ncbi:MAG: hypothetical protein ACK559_34790, partial [bacterium]
MIELGGGAPARGLVGAVGEELFLPLFLDGGDSLGAILLADDRLGGLDLGVGLGLELVDEGVGGGGGELLRRGPDLGHEFFLEFADLLDGAMPEHEGVEH